MGQSVLSILQSPDRSQESVQIKRDKNYLRATDPRVATGKAKAKRKQVNSSKTKPY